MKPEVPIWSRPAVAVRSQSGLWIGCILLVALLLRLYQLGTESLWVDEMISIEEAETLRVQFPYVRPFYFLLLHGWMQLGSSDAWLRGLSVVFGVGTVFLTYELGRRTVGATTGLITALLMALDPLFINHAQEIRMYTLIPFLSVGGTLALTQVFKRPTHQALSWWIAARTALLLTNANNVLLLFPDMVLASWTFRKQPRWLLKFGAGLAVIGLFFLPVVYALVFGGKSEEFMQNQVDQYSKPGLLQIAGMLTQLTIYWPLRNLLESNAVILDRNQLSDTSLLSNLLSAHAASLLFYEVMTLVIFGLLGLAIAALLDRERTQQLRWIAIWALLPTLCMLGVSYLKGSIWFPRYLMFVAPYFLLLIATALVILWHWRRSVAIGIAIAGIIALGGGLKDYYTTLYRDNWYGVAQYVETQEQSGDLLVYYSVPRFLDYSLPRYYQGANPIHLVNRNLAELDQLPTHQSRTWLVCWIYCDEEAAMKQILQKTVGENFVVQEHQTFRSLDAAPIEVTLATDRP